MNEIELPLHGSLSEFRLGKAIRPRRNWGTVIIIILEILILVAVLVRGV